MVKYRYFLKRSPTYKQFINEEEFNKLAFYEKTHYRKIAAETEECSANESKKTLEKIREEYDPMFFDGLVNYDDDSDTLEEYMSSKNNLSRLVNQNYD